MGRGRRLRDIPSAEASMMEGLSVIDGAKARRDAVDRMVESSYRFARQKDEGSKEEGGRERSKPAVW